MVTGATDQGAKINKRAESTLMLAVYFIKHQNLVSRDVVFRNVTLSGVKKLTGQRKMEEVAMEVSITTLMVHTKDWLKTLKSIEEYLRIFNGVNRRSLSYVVRKKLVTTDEV